jgi:hypothetical protein
MLLRGRVLAMIDEDAILREAIFGDPVKEIAKRHKCSQTAVNAILDRHAAEMLTPSARARALALEVDRLDCLEQTFHRIAIANQDAQAGTLVTKISQRRSALLGLDQPHMLRLDLTAVPENNDGKTNTQRMLEAIRQLKGEVAEPDDEDQEPMAEKVN